MNVFFHPSCALFNIQYNTIQYNTKFVKCHVAVASEALANRTVKKHTLVTNDAYCTSIVINVQMKCVMPVLDAAVVSSAADGLLRG